MSPLEVVQHIEEKGFTLHRNGDLLGITGNLAKLTANDEEMVQKSKSSILAILRARESANDTEPPGSTAESGKPVYVGVQWGNEQGWLRLRNPLTGEMCEIPSRGAPRWLFDRLNNSR